MSHKPVQKRKTTLLIIWIVPIISMFFAFFFLFKYYNERGEDIVITFEDGSGFHKRKTYLIYKGIKVGMVKDIALHEGDLSKIDVTVNVDKKAADAIAREGIKFYKVEPKVSLTEISGLKAIIGGVYIDVYTPKDDYEALLKLPKKYRFVAQKHKPIDINNPNLHFKIVDKDGDVKNGAPIIYKNFEIGRVVESELINDEVIHLVMVKRQYASLIKEDTKFYNISALDMKASLHGVQLKVDSLASLVAGGLGFTSESDSKVLTSEDKRFRLYKSIDDIVCDMDNVIVEAEGGYNLDKDFNKVYFKGVEAGSIESVEYDAFEDKSYIELRLQPKFRKLTESGAYFWIVTPKASLDGIEGLDAVIKGNYINFISTSELPDKGDNYHLHTTPPKEPGVTIKLNSQINSSIGVGSRLYYYNVVVGVVEKVDLNISSNQLDIELNLFDRYRELVTSSTMFYTLGAIEADLSFESLHVKASPLDAALRGGISFDTPQFDKSKPKSHYKLYDSYKTLQKDRYLKSEGESVTLLAHNSESITIGSNVFYEGVKAGEVTAIEFDSSADMIEITLFIEKPFLDKVNESSRFYNSSALKIDAGFSALSVELESIKSLLNGSISFTCKKSSSSTKRIFELKESKIDKSETHTSMVLLANDASGLSIGSKILYRGIEIGSITRITLLKEGVNIAFDIQNNYTHLFVNDTVVFKDGLKVGLDGIENTNALLSGSFLSLRVGESKEMSRSFTLEAKPIDAAAIRKGTTFTLLATKKSSIEVGSRVLFRQMPIGYVQNITLSKESKYVEMDIFVDACYSELVRENSLFYFAGVISTDVSLFGVKIETETIKTMINGAIVLVTPDEVEAKAKASKRFTLYNKPEEEWLAYSADINRTLKCQ